MIDLRIAYKILMAAELGQPPFEAPTKTLAEIARDVRLEIVPINFTRGMYHGQVLGVDGTQCLVHHRAQGAILLDLTEIPEADILPRKGDTVRVEASHGKVKVTVVVSARNQREDRRQRLAAESHSGSRMGVQ